MFARFARRLALVTLGAALTITLGVLLCAPLMGAATYTTNGPAVLTPRARTVESTSRMYRMNVVDVSLTSPTLYLDVTNRSCLRISSDVSLTTGNGIRFSGGKEGQVLTIVNGSTETLLVVDDGTTNSLAGNWSGGASDALKLICNSSTARWVETGRSDN